MGLFTRATPAPDRAPKAKAPKAKKAAPKKRPPMAQDIQVSPFFADHTRDGLADRFNQLRAKRSDHVLVTLCLGVCLLASLGMNAYQIMRGSVAVQAVVLDGESGHILHNDALEPMKDVADVFLQRELRSVITDLRTISTDPAATQSRFAAAYRKVVQKSGAAVFLSDFYTRPENSPGQIVGNGGQRSVVEFTGPSRVAGTDTWTVTWVERTAMGTGAGAGVTQDLWRASMTVKQVPVTDLETAQTNPLGVFIDGIEWNKVSSRVLDLEELGDITTMEALYPGVAGPTTAAAPAARPRPATAAQPTAQAAE